MGAERCPWAGEGLLPLKMGVRGRGETNTIWESRSPPAVYQALMVFPASDRRCLGGVHQQRYTVTLLSFFPE